MEDVDLVIRRASRHFSDLLDDDSNPLVVALALQDTSSVGLQHYAGEFAQLHSDLKSCLKAQVDSNYQGFNSAVGAYRTVVHGFNDSHAHVRQARDQLVNLRGCLDSRRPMLRDLQESSLRHKQMLELLDVVEGLDAVPDKFEECVAQKRFFQALHVLSSARSTINAHNLLQVPEISNLYSYVVSQQASLVSTLVEELKAHIYLRSPFTCNRWEPFRVADIDSRTWTGEDLENALKSRLSFENEVGKRSQLENFLHQEDTNLFLSEDQPAEQDSFEYIKSLLVTLTHLNSLGTGIEQLVQTLRSDFHQLVEETVVDAVKQAHITVESLRRSVPSHLFDQKSESLRILEALAVTLFTKFAASLEAHRVVADVTQKLGDVDFPLTDVCSALKSELADFLLTYIDESGIPALRSRNRSFSSLDSGTTRSRWLGPLFEFGDEPPTSAEDLDKLLKSLGKSVPGLTPDIESLGSPFADTIREAHLSVVVPAHILNVRALLEPTAGFLQRTRYILKGFDSCVSHMDKFLDDWLHRVFLPRLELALQRAFDDIVADPNGLRVHSNWTERSQLPITVASVKFVDLVHLLCQLLNTGIHFRAEYANLLLDLLETIQQYFEDKLVEQDVSGGKNQVSQAILRDSEPLLRALYKNDTSKFGSELKIYLARRHSSKSSLKLTDLLDTEVLRTMAILATSLEWIATRLREMRVVRATGDVSEDSQALKTRVRKRWSLLDTHSHQSAGAILDGEELTRFDTINSGLGGLAWRIVSLLRIDTAFRVVYYLDQMVERGNFGSRRREEPNLVVDTLQRELASTNDICRVRLSEHDRKYVFYGVPQLMQELFILKSEAIPELTEAGQDRICSNIFSLQQLLTSFVADPKSVNFGRAANYYDLFRLSPSVILEKARNRQTDLTFDDLSLLLRLKHRHDSRGPALSEQLKQLKECFEDSSQKVQNRKLPAREPLSQSSQSAGEKPPPPDKIQKPSQSTLTEAYSDFNAKNPEGPRATYSTPAVSPADSTAVNRQKDMKLAKLATPKKSRQAETRSSSKDAEISALNSHKHRQTEHSNIDQKPSSVGRTVARPPEPRVSSDKFTHNPIPASTRPHVQQQSVMRDSTGRRPSSSSTSSASSSSRSQATPSERALEAARRVRERSSSQRLRQ